jgi:hypothetical protein
MSAAYVDDAVEVTPQFKFVVEGTETAGFIPDAVPEAAALLSAGALGSRDEVEAEIDLMLAETRTLYDLEPDQAMRLMAAFSARATELYVHLHRVEGRRREFKQIRTMQVDMLLKELDRQFRIASRTVEIRRQDLDLLRGS